MWCAGSVSSCGGESILSGVCEWGGVAWYTASGMSVYMSVCPFVVSGEACLVVKVEVHTSLLSAGSWALPTGTGSLCDHVIVMLLSCDRQVPLRYLLGTLYVNFSLIWEPVCQLIRFGTQPCTPPIHVVFTCTFSYPSSYSCVEHRVLFWSVFGEALESVSGKAGTEMGPVFCGLTLLSIF